MAVKITRDADNKWYTYVDFQSWFSKQVTDIGGTFSISSASWSIPAVITQEAETKVIGDKAVFVGSGGSNDVDYDLVCTITYVSSVINVSNLTQDKTITVRMRDL